MADPQFFKYPSLAIAQQVFTITNPAASKSSQDAALTGLKSSISEHKMAALYRYLAHPTTGVLNAPGDGNAKQPPQLRRGSSNAAHMLASKKTAVKVDFPWNEKHYEELKADNDKELSVIKKEEDDAVEKAGDTEVQAARAKRAEFWARVCDKEKALEAYESLFEKTSILGTKIDIVFAIIRLGLFFNDKFLVKRNVARANTLVESGGDWDRRNRLKAYQGLHLLTVRSYNLAAPLLLDSLSTFTSYELCSYSNLIVYALLAGTVSLKRVDFKAKVVDAPEIKAVVGSSEERVNALSGITSAGPGAGDEEMKDAPAESSATAGSAPVNLTMLGQQGSSETTEVVEAVDFQPLADLVSSLYHGNYKAFFTALSQVEQEFLSQDRYLAEHKAWAVREMRLRAYQQLLQSYRVVGLPSMAKDFGVSVEFLDK